ncbi:MAG TPA: hypothetical protein VK886_08125 [Vicinamibacterales bacterium]|nr:hypothetical protein [Vicinamibacterales bacterium]
MLSVDPGLKTPYAHHASTDVERELGHGLSMSAHFVYARGFDQLGTIDYNPVTSPATQARPLDINRVPGTSASVSSIVTLASGRPHNILAGSDLTGDGNGGATALPGPARRGVRVLGRRASSRTRHPQLESILRREGIAMRMPDWLEPMAATLTQERFSGPDWVFERKFDGIRLLAYKRGAEVQLYSRNRLPQNLPAVADAVAKLPADEVILDGEVTWDGRSAYHVFDILWLNGRSVTALPLEERRALLEALPFEPPMRSVALVDDDVPWERARRERWEGVIAKRRGSPYEHRRSKHWLKMKCEASQELVVGGFTDPRGTRVGLGALLVGYHEGRDFVFAGKIGTGFDTKLLRDLRRRLDRIEIAASPFTKAIGLPRLRVHWVKPEVVVQVGFIEWTAHDKLRHPRLLGLRHDKDAREVTRDRP